MLNETSKFNPRSSNSTVPEYLEGFVSVEIKTEQEVKNFLELAGLPYDVFMSRWGWGLSASKTERAMNSNISAIQGLEKFKPGISKVLYSEFGIYNFGRFPQQLLLRQFEEMYVDRPYGAVVCSISDWNGSFFDKDWRNSISGLDKQLKATHAIRVGEAMNIFELGRFFNRLNKRYEKKNKITFSLISAHGKHDHVLFGSPKKPSDYITMSDLQDVRWQKYADMFLENGTIILDSCSSGQGTKNIAIEMSDQLQLNVIAPDGEGSIKSIRPWIAGDQMYFDVVYSYGVGTHEILNET